MSDNWLIYRWWYSLSAFWMLFSLIHALKSQADLHSLILIIIIPYAYCVSCTRIEMCQSENVVMEASSYTKKYIIISIVYNVYVLPWVTITILQSIENDWQKRFLLFIGDSISSMPICFAVIITNSKVIFCGSTKPLWEWFRKMQTSTFVWEMKKMKTYLFCYGHIIETAQPLWNI